MFLKIRLVTMFLLASLLLLSACQSTVSIMGQEVNTDGGSYRVVSVQELQAMLEDKDFTMINVHIPWQGDIPQTDLRLAYDQIEKNPNQLPREKDTKILVYCLTSGMAKKAISTLLNQGYTNLWMLEGGTTEWVDAGYQIEQ